MSIQIALASMPEARAQTSVMVGISIGCWSNPGLESPGRGPGG